MFISLRKAAALQKEILNAVPSVVALISLSAYEDTPGELIQTAGLDAIKKIEIRDQLMNALYEIRDSVAAKNIEVGIHTLVSRLARVDKDVAFYSSLVNSEATPNQAVIEARIDRIRSTNPDHYSYSENVNISVFPQASLDSLKLTATELKKEKVKIQDKLLELNIKHSITLSDATVSVLTSHGLI